MYQYVKFRRKRQLCIYGSWWQEIYIVWPINNFSREIWHHPLKCQPYKCIVFLQQNIKNEYPLIQRIWILENGITHRNKVKSCVMEMPHYSWSLIKIGICFCLGLNTNTGNCDRSWLGVTLHSYHSPIYFSSFETSTSHQYLGMGNLLDSPEIHLK